MLAPPLLLVLLMVAVPLLGVIVIVLYFFSTGELSLGLLARTWNMFVIDVRGDWVRVPENYIFHFSVVFIVQAVQYLLKNRS